MCVSLGMHRWNICAERSNGKWCSQHRARGICHNLTHQCIKSACTCEKARPRSVLFAHSRAQTQQPGSLLHSINHPSSNCPWLPCSLTICSLTTSPYKWQTMPSTSVFPGNRGVYQGPPSLVGVVSRLANPWKFDKVKVGMQLHIQAQLRAWFSAPGNGTITTKQEGCTLEPQEATGAGRVYITSDSGAAITLPRSFAAETMNRGQPLFIETAASRQE